MKNILKVLLLNLICLSAFAPLNCLNKTEELKLKAIEESYYGLVQQSMTDFLDQIKTTKEDDFICLKLTETSLLAKEQLMLKILDSTFLFLSKKNEVIKNVFTRLKPLFIASNKDSCEKEERKFALFHAISSIENEINNVVKGTEAENYLTNKKHAKNETIKFVPVLLIGVLMWTFSRDLEKEKNQWKVVPKFLGYTLGMFFAGFSCCTISLSWFLFFLSTLLCNKEKLESIKMRYKEQTNLDILNQPVVKTEFKKATGQAYISDETLLRLLADK